MKRERGPGPLPILVLAPTPRELAPLCELFSGAGPPILHLAVCGVGKANAAFCAGSLLSGGACSALAVVGCAGAFPGAGLEVGDVAIAEREVLADEGTLAPEGFLDLERLGLPLFDGSLPGGAKAVHNEVPVNPPVDLSSPALEGLARRLGCRVRAGTLVTVSTCSGTDARAKELWSRHRPLAETMEGGALALAALRAGLPFLEVRGISNLVGDRDTSRWDVAAAARRAAEAAASLLGVPTERAKTR